MSGHPPADVMAYAALAALTVMALAWLYLTVEPYARGWWYHLACLRDAGALPYGHHAKPRPTPSPAPALRHHAKTRTA